MDAVVIVACVVLTWLAWEPLGSLALGLPVTLGHFFLFCNVFRIRRSYELIWTAVYIVNLAYWMLLRDSSWFGVLTVQSPLTIALIVLEIRAPRYHGALRRWLKPGLWTIPARSTDLAVAQSDLPRATRAVGSAPSAVSSCDQEPEPVSRGRRSGEQ